MVGLRKGGAVGQGRGRPDVMEVNDAVKAADVVMIPLPDEQFAEVYNKRRAQHQAGRRWPFAHGFNRTHQVVPAPTWTWDGGPAPPVTPCATPTPRAAACSHLVAGAPGQVGQGGATWPCPTPWPTAAARPASSRHQRSGRDRDRPVRRAGRAVRRRRRADSRWATRP